MSPRPRKASDDDIFVAAMAVMRRLGPTELTLADIAKEAGLTAGALVQRFGSKRALLLALSERAASGMTDLFAGLRSAQPTAIAALRAYGDCMAEMATTPAALARNLAWLLQDVTDPALRRHTAKQARATRRELTRLAQEAIEAGDLRPPATSAQIARSLEITVGGSLLAWAIYQEGSARQWVRHDVDALLAPYVAQHRRRPPRVATRA